MADRCDLRRVRYLAEQKIAKIFVRVAPWVMHRPGLAHLSQPDARGFVVRFHGNKFGKSARKHPSPRPYSLGFYIPIHGPQRVGAVLAGGWISRRLLR